MNDRSTKDVDSAMTTPEQISVHGWTLTKDSTWFDADEGVGYGIDFGEVGIKLLNHTTGGWRAYMYALNGIDGHTQSSPEAAWEEMVARIKEIQKALGVLLMELNDGPIDLE